MYTIENFNIKQEDRQQINENIIYLLNNNLLNKYDLTLNHVFNTFTGKGRLHNLKQEDFKNYHEYSQEKKIKEMGQFFTPHHLARFMVRMLKPQSDDMILDLTCGIGNFFNWCPDQSLCYGNEINYDAFLVAKKLYPKSRLTNTDMTDYHSDNIQFDFNIGNPPFHLRLKNDQLSHWYYIRKSYELLKPMGIMAIIVPDSFLNDAFFDKNKITELNSMFHHIATLKLPHNIFNAKIKTKIIVLNKKSKHDISEIRYSHQKNITLTEINDQIADAIYKQYLEKYNVQRIELKKRIFLDLKQKSDTKKEFWYKTDKLIYDISIHPETKEYTHKCREYINRFLTQERPVSMDDKEWNHVKITDKKVIAYLKYYLNKQNEKPVDKIELVKTDHTLKHKAYSNKMKKKLLSNEQSINDMIYSSQYAYSDKKYKKLVIKKLKKYQLQNSPLEILKPDQSVIDFMDGFTLQGISLTDLQYQDISKFLMKDYCINGWGMGSGKSISAIYWIEYKKQRHALDYPMLLSTAKSVSQNWTAKLENWNIPYQIIKSKEDLTNLEKGKIILFNFNTLIKINKDLKKFIKMHYSKTLLVIDESHELNNTQAKRTRAAKNCFARMKYKYFMTGTLTLNSIVELYPQIEILYNNSVNMVCECNTKYRLDKNGELENQKNSSYLKPYDAYHGMNTFKSCHNPYKVTVFGIKKQTQKILNPDKLKSLLEKTVINRSFKQIAGDKYKINQIRISQTREEKELYNIIMKEFYKLAHYFKQSSSNRKESMLKIIRQITLLRDSCSVPFKFKEFTGMNFKKSDKILSMIKEKNEKWAIGCILKEAVKHYETALKQTGKKVFVITGDKPFHTRQNLIHAFEKTTNGILLSTQQSLSEAIDIPSCQNVIIESLMWNIPRILQYAFRFVRFNSEGITNINFISYYNTIEMNMLALLMAKEQINDFIKTFEIKEQSDLFQEYNIDSDIFNFMLEHAKDQYGKSYITAA